MRFFFNRIHFDESIHRMNVRFFLKTMQVKADFVWLHHPWDCRKGALRQSEFETHHSLQMGGTGNSGLADGLQGHGGHAAWAGRSVVWEAVAPGVLLGGSSQLVSS